MCCKGNVIARNRMDRRCLAEKSSAKAKNIKRGV
nr:MAG TPA: hypothetical protein [Caudoviricetes sp.]